jgi:hypothetical protein
MTRPVPSSTTAAFASHKVADPLLDGTTEPNRTKKNDSDDATIRSQGSLSSSSVSPTSDHQILDALRAIAYMTSSPLQRQQYGEQETSANTAGSHHRTHSSGPSSRSGAATSSSAHSDDSVAALVDLLAAGVDAQRLAVIIETR